jgi:homoserine dehydrogenase
MNKLIVLKFGSSVLKSAEDLPNIVHEVYRWYREGHRVIAVVSAVGNSTEQLIRASRMLTESPEPFATAELLATGERTSAALLGIALDRAGVPARVVNPREIGFEVAGSPLDSEPVRLDVHRIEELLRNHPVLIVPGFFGTDTAGRTHLLGRGGSDLTAAFIASELKARCRLLKDVDGVYESDPAQQNAHPRRFAALGYEDALRVAGKLIQSKAVEHFRSHGTSCEVAALALPYHTLVHPGATRRADSLPPKRIDVVILGLGTVGFGVYQRLCANSDRFRVIGFLVRERARHEAAGVPTDLLYTCPETLATLKPALVIDALPGLEPSHALIKHYLSQGIDIVSANKAVIAQFGTAFAEIAERTGATLRYSAAVGGSAPMLEAVDHALERSNMKSLVAVLNGTCNFLIDACAAGDSLASAIGEAQRLGFAEADPTEDTCGRDAARKMAILARHAFEVEATLTEVQTFDESMADAARSAALSGQRLRQLARATMMGDRKVVLSVSFELVGPESPFYSLSGEWNALSVALGNGETHLARGRGAGRWPTTEAVIADVLEIARLRRQEKNTQGRILSPRLASA